MANELRVRNNFMKGLISDNPLLIGATTLNSALLANIPAIGTTQHFPIVFDPEGTGGASEIAYITAHTASATTATIVRGQEGSVARQHAQNITWTHGPLASDFPQSSVYTMPSSTTVASTTLASFATPILIAVSVLAGQVVDIEAILDATCSADNVVYWGLRRNPSTVLAKSIFYTAGAGTRPQGATPRWTDTSPGSGAVTYELLGATSGGTLTAYPSDGSTTISLTPSSAGGTQIKATPRWL